MRHNSQTGALKRLNEGQVRRYRDEGILFPLDALSEREAKDARRALETFESSLGEASAAPANRRKLHVLLPWMRTLVEDPRILDAVEDLIGPDILVFNSTFFIKEPGTDAVAAWHQDATYFGLEPHLHVTAWVAFTEAAPESGCMEFVRGSHKWGQLRHAARTNPNSVNAGAQTIIDSFDDSETVPLILTLGRFSLHHTLAVHRSAPNRSRDRRIGLGISYIPAHVRHKGSHRMPASLVRGLDRYGHFDLEPDPRGLSPQEAESAHARAYARYREGYEEQVALHAAA